MTVSLELDRAARARGLASEFVPTGQTGIAIAGWGISVDAVVADFVAGAAERLVVEGARARGRAPLVEGQGSLSHPAYSGVTLGLLHGSAPHAFVLCHKAGATEIDGYPGHPLLSLPELVELHERIVAAAPTRPRRVHRAQHRGDLDGRRRAGRDRAPPRRETGLVADDPVRFGAAPARSRPCSRPSGRLTDARAALVTGRYTPRGRGRGWLSRTGAVDAVATAARGVVLTLALRGRVALPPVVRPPTSAPTTTPASTPPTVARRSIARMAATGLRQTIMTVRWLPSDPNALVEERDARPSHRRARASPGSGSSFAVYPYPPREIEDAHREARRRSPPGSTRSPSATPSVRQFVVGNEPNQPAFFRPQFADGQKQASAARFGPFLAAGYDALKAVDPTIPSSASGCRPGATTARTRASNVSTSPVRFLAALGAWYRASGRTRPLMDGLSFHPYPNRATDSLERGYAWPNAGFANLDRIKQAFWDAFAGNGAADDRERPAALPRRGRLAGRHRGPRRVHGRRRTSSSRPRATQASVYGDLVRQALCDPTIAEVNFFGFYDDPLRDRLPVGAAPRRRHAAPRRTTVVRAAIASRRVPRRRPSRGRLRRGSSRRRSRS